MGTVQITCPHCQQPVDIDKSLRGTTVRCSRCGTEFAVAPPPVNPILTQSPNEQAPLPTGTSPLAMVSLVLGILGCIPPLGLVGLICGIIALVGINKSQGRLPGKGTAIAAIVVSPLMTLIIVALLLPVFTHDRGSSRMGTCSNNQRQIEASIQMYAQDHDEIFPTDQTIWRDLTQGKQASLDPGVLICPTKGRNTPNSYGYNKRLSKIPLGVIKDPVTTIATADGGDRANLLYSVQDIDFRHSRMSCAIASYVDGHVDTIPKGKQMLLKP